MLEITVGHSPTKFILVQAFLVLVRQNVQAQIVVKNHFFLKPIPGNIIKLVCSAIVNVNMSNAIALRRILLCIKKCSDQNHFCSDTMS